MSAPSRPVALRAALRRPLKSLAPAVLALSLVLLGQDVVRLDPAEQVSLPYHFSLMRWEAANLLSKWTHLAYTALPWVSRPGVDGAARVEEYFSLGEREAAVAGEIERAAALPGVAGVGDIDSLEAELARTAERRTSLRNDVEEVLEAAISSALSEFGLGRWGPLVLPPVDFRLGRPPAVLITSPRDRIERSHEARLDPAVTVSEAEAMEAGVRERWDLSGLVVGVGGIATYPASVADDLPLRDTLALAAHEWVHHYLVATLRPLGLRTFSSPEMQSLAETLAGMAGREIGARAFGILSGAPLPDVTPAPEGPPPESDEPGDGEDAFDFARDMRETRLRVDGLLADGRIEEAESYMEVRRTYFVENGVFIRKINQAYFAFAGTYAEAPESVSPIGGQMRELRALVPDLKDFVNAVSGASSYADFLALLDRHRSEAGR